MTHSSNPRIVSDPSVRKVRARVLIIPFHFRGARKYLLRGKSNGLKLASWPLPRLLGFWPLSLPLPSAVFTQSKCNLTNVKMRSSERVYNLVLGRVPNFRVSSEFESRSAFEHRTRVGLKMAESSTRVFEYSTQHEWTWKKLDSSLTRLKILFSARPREFLLSKLFNSKITCLILCSKSVKNCATKSNKKL